MPFIFFCFFYFTLYVFIYFIHILPFFLRLLIVIAPAADSVAAAAIFRLCVVYQRTSYFFSRNVSFFLLLNIPSLIFVPTARLFDAFIWNAVFSPRCCYFFLIFRFRKSRSYFPCFLPTLFIFLCFTLICYLCCCFSWETFLSFPFYSFLFFYFPFLPFILSPLFLL